MTFRINYFSIEGENFGTPTVYLSKAEAKNSGNFFTVIIGNNGTGKSRFISSIVESFRDIGEGKRRRKINYKINYEIEGRMYDFERTFGRKLLETNQYINEYQQEYAEIPSKIITITSSISDKFGVDSFDRRRELERPPSKKEEYYIYLGPKQMHGASSRALMDKAISIFLSNIGNRSHNASYRHIFSYLKYEPVMKLTYKIGYPRFFNHPNNILSGPSLKEYLANQASKRGGFRERSINKLIEEKDDSYWDNLSETLRYIASSNNTQERRPDFTILVNFSEKNETREKEELGFKQAKLYSTLEDLRRFDLVRGPYISLYKKNGSEFDFSDASSGESSILSTLIALVPKIENNSLIVIDEPEISLHPSWQYRYIELLDKIISTKHGCHVIIATHSHFLISDLPLERSSVVHFREAKHNSLTVEYIDGETQGLSAEDILLNVFGLPSTRNYYLSKNIADALELVAEGKAKSEKFSQLINEFKKIFPNLKDIDPLKGVIETLLNIENQ